jgi:DNA-binding transcriptional ArsR family regulator
MGYTKASIKKPAVRPGAGRGSAHNRFPFEQAERVSQILGAAGDSTRLHILLLLSHHEMGVQAIATQFRRSQSALSNHIALLRHSRLIEARREGARNVYSLTGAGKTLTHRLQSLMAPGTVPPPLAIERAKTSAATRKGVVNTQCNANMRSKPSDTAGWKVLNRRRLDLIDKEAEQGLTAAEGTELRALQKKADAYLDIVAPLPFEIFEKLRLCAKIDGLDVSFLDEE